MSASKLRAYHETILDQLADSSDPDAFVVTGRFERRIEQYEHIEYERIAEPYERIEIAPWGERRYAHTIKRPGGADSLDRWFARTNDSLPVIEEPQPERRESYWWLAISLAGGGIVLATLYAIL